ncbi:transposase, partial [Shigella boydii]
STLKSPSYTKSVSWQHYRLFHRHQRLAFWRASPSPLTLSR